MGFSSWPDVLRVLATGVASYALLVLLLRISGKRTLSKLNAFDLAVTVAIGSTLSSVLLSGDVPLSDGVAGFVVLILGQWVVARLSTRSPRFAHWVRSEPRLLLLDGRFLEANMDEERITRAEVLSAVRSRGVSRVEDVGAVVLETDGSLTVLPGAAADDSALQGVRR